MKSNKYSAFLVFMILALFTCGCKDSFIYEDSIILNANEFTFLPESPTTEQEVQMIYYGCIYYSTSSVTIDKSDILVLKKFNGAMKLPCILKQDTISFGKLQKGRYQVTLEIIDINPFTDDSLFHSESKVLYVF